MSTEQIVAIITETIGSNFPALLAIIGVGAGVKIVLDIIFNALYNITNGRIS